MASRSFKERMFAVGKSAIRIYALLVIVAFLGQRYLMYPAPKTPRIPQSQRGKLLVLEGAGGRKVHAFHIPAQLNKPTVILFHGNAEQLADQLSLAEDFADVGLGAYAVEFPGYGVSSESQTTELNVYSDAETALRHLETHLKVDRNEQVLLGRSLGTGVVVEMARRGFGIRVILISPYTSMLEMAEKMMPFLPVRWLLRDRYDSLGKASALSQTILVVHGMEDNVVPCAMGRRVAAALPNASLELVPHASHNDIFEIGGIKLWRTILSFALNGSTNFPSDK